MKLKIIKEQFAEGVKRVSGVQSKQNYIENLGQ